MNDKKIIAITGSESEIGFAVAQKFTNEGWLVIGIDCIPENKVKNTYFKYKECDLTDRAKAKEIFDLLESESYETSALFTATYKELNLGFEEVELDTWQEILDTWLGGAINACAAVSPYMVKRKFGKIIIFTPDYRNDPRENILNATAAGTLHGFAKCFGTEMAPHNVMVNGLYPNLPIDLAKTADFVFYLAEVDGYTTAQVISITGKV